MGLAVSLRFDIQDGSGKKSFTKIHVPLGFAISDYLEFAVSMAQIIADLNNGIVTRAGLCIGLDLSTATLKTDADYDSDVTDKGAFGFDTSALGFYKNMFIPTLDELKVVDNTDTIDVLDTDVQAFLGAMLDGIVVTGGTIQPTDWRGNDITAVRYNKEQFRRRNV